MSAMKRYLEDLVYSMKYDDFYTLLKSKGWKDQDIRDFYDLYH